MEFSTVALNDIEVVSKTPYDSNELSTAFLHYVGELCVQRHQDRMAGV